ncbi:transposable element Tcb2 transposase [Trichonephila clavipes]|nr:transposable element Tcb2 transposase [Trichonephila clavipes]
MANNQSVRRHLCAFTRGRIIGKLEEGRSVTRTAIRGFSSGRPRGTTPADDRYIVLQARRNRRPTAGEIARHTTQATGRPISRFTVARRLHDALYDESRFSLSSDSHRILIWKERGSRNHPSNIIERDRYGGRGVLVWGGIMLGSRTDLHIFDAGSVNGTRYCNEILLPYLRLFRGAMGLQFLFMDDNAPCHRTVAAEELLESRRLAARTLPPVTIRELRLALQDEWAAMPQQLIDTLILSMGRRCETWLAVSGEIISPTKDRMFLAGHPSQGCFGLQVMNIESLRSTGLVVKDTDACLACHGFEASTAEVPPSKGGQCMLNMSKLKCLLTGIEVSVGITFQDGNRFNSCQVIYSQFSLAIHQNDHQARRRFVEWAQNEIAIVPDFHKRILFSDEAHFWLNGYVNKQNCRIWSEANPQVYVETPLHPEKLTVWCAL